MISTQESNFEFFDVWKKALSLKSYTVGVRRKKYTILSSTVEELNGIFGEKVVLPAHSVIKYDLYSIPEALSINMIFVTFPKKIFFPLHFPKINKMEPSQKDANKVCVLCLNMFRTLV